MDFPIIITNFKTYPNATGNGAVDLAKLHETVAKEENVNIVCCVQAGDIYRVVQGTGNMPVFAQHFDSGEPGKNTGKTILESIQVYGAKGSLLNHAENQVTLEEIMEGLARAKEVGMEVVVCAVNAAQVGEIAKLSTEKGIKPQAIAIEPPELIGGDISVTTASPDIITNALKEVGDIPLLVGAGVKTGEDVKTALKLGAKGVLLASGITKSDDPKSALLDLTSGV